MQKKVNLIQITTLVILGIPTTKPASHQPGITSLALLVVQIVLTFIAKQIAKNLKAHVTNITFTGSAMVNWNRRLLVQGVTTDSWC